MKKDDEHLDLLSYSSSSTPLYPLVSSRKESERVLCVGTVRSRSRSLAGLRFSCSLEFAKIRSVSSFDSMHVSCARRITRVERGPSKCLKERERERKKEKERMNGRAGELHTEGSNIIASRSVMQLEA